MLHGVGLRPVVLSFSPTSSVLTNYVPSDESSMVCRARSKLGVAAGSVLVSLRGSGSETRSVPPLVMLCRTQPLPPQFTELSGYER